MKNLLFPLFALCLLVSCSKESSPSENEDGRMSISSCYIVKNNNSLSENFSSPIGLYVLTEDNQPYAAASYKNSATLVSGEWKIKETVYVIAKGKVYAYHPYSLGDNPENLAVNMANQVDLLYSKAAFPIGPGTFSLSLKLYHALSQITVSVEGAEVASLKLYSPLTGKFNVCTGSFSSLVSGDVSSTSGKMLIVPHSTSSATDIVIRLKNGSEYFYSLSNMNFLPGENYTFQFKINTDKEKLDIMSITVEDWISDNIYNDYLR